MGRTQENKMKETWRLPALVLLGTITSNLKLVTDQHIGSQSILLAGCTHMTFLLTGVAGLV
jgi:hypothetical protein